MMNIIFIVACVISFAVPKVSSNEVGRPTCRAGICDDRPECPKTTCRCIFPSNVDCSVYYLCVNGRPLRYKCSDGLLFNKERLSCDYSSNVNCSNPDNTSPATSISDNNITFNVTHEFTTVKSTVSTSVDEQTETVSRKSRDITDIITDASKPTATDTERTENNTLVNVSSTTILPTSENIVETTISEENTIAQNVTERSSTLVSVNVTETTKVTTTDSVSETPKSTIDLETDAPATDSSIITTEIVDETTSVSEGIKTTINVTESSSTSVSINITETTKLTTTDSVSDTPESTTDLETDAPATDSSTGTTEIVYETTAVSERIKSTINETESSSTTVSRNITETSKLTTTDSVSDVSESTTDLKTDDPATDSLITTTEFVDGTTAVSEGIKTTINVTDSSSIISSISSRTKILTTDSVAESTTDFKTETAADNISTVTARSTSFTNNNSTVIENNTDISTMTSKEAETLQPISTKATQNESTTFFPLSTTFKTYGTDQTNTESDETRTTDISKTTKIFTTTNSEKISEVSDMTDIPTNRTSRTSTSFSSTDASFTTENAIETTEQPINVTSQDPLIYKSSTLIPSSTENQSTSEREYNIVNISTTVAQVDSSTQTREERLEFTCPERYGLYPDPYNCTRFFHCSHFIPYQKECPSNLHFNAKLQVCDWSYRAGCDSSIEIITTTETTTNVPETNNTIACGCDCCEIPLLDDCSSYILCINHKGHIITCDEGLDFNPMTSTCDLKENVECKTNIQCPSAIGKFAYPHSCTHYLECVNGTKIVNQCPEGLNFDSMAQNCSRTNCEAIKSSTTKAYFTTLTSETKNFTNSKPRSTNLQTTFQYSNFTDVTKDSQNTSQSTEAPYTSTVTNDPEVSKTTNIIMHSTDAVVTSSTELLVTTKNATVRTEKTTENNTPSTVQLITDAVSTSEDNETLVPRETTFSTTERATNISTEISNFSNLTTITLPDHDTTKTKTKTETSISVTESLQNASLSTTEADKSTFFHTTTITPEADSTKHSTAEEESSTLTHGTAFTGQPTNKYSDDSTEPNESEITETSAFTVTKLTSVAVSEMNVTMETMGSSTQETDATTEITNTKGLLTTVSSGKTTEKDKEEVTDTPVSLYTTDSKGISSLSTITTATNESYEKTTRLNTDIPKTTTQITATSFTTKNENETSIISTKSTDASTQSTVQNNSTQEVTTTQQQEFSCPERFGVFPDPMNCSTFYHCSQWIPNLTLCPSDLHYSPKLKTCDWPSDAGCGSDIHPTTEGQIATTSIPETTNTTECDCNCCELPIIGECRSYVLCIEHMGSIITCEEGLYFNPMTSTCDLEEHVTCEEDVECPAPSGKFPYPHSCKHYLECTNGTQTVRKCPGTSNFDALLGNCSSSAECGSSDISTTEDAGNKYSTTSETTTSKDVVSEIVTGKVSDIPESTKTTETESLASSTIYFTSLEPEIPDNQTTISDVRSSENTERTLLSSKNLPITTEIPQSTITATRETNDVPQTKDVHPSSSSVSSARTTDSSVTEINEVTTDGASSSIKDMETSDNAWSTSNIFSTKVATTTSDAKLSSDTNANNFTFETTKLASESTEVTKNSQETTQSKHTTVSFHSNMTTGNIYSTTEINTAMTNTTFYSTKEATKLPRTVSELHSTEPSTRPPTSNFTCPERFGMFPDPKNCSRFYHCSHFYPLLKVCPSRLHFNSNLTICDSPEQANCDFPDVYPPEENVNPCKQPNGLFQAHNCSQFTHCSNGIPYTKDCPEGLMFNTKNLVCDWPENVNCSATPISPPAVPETDDDEANKTCDCECCLFPDKNDCSSYFFCLDGRLRRGHCSDSLLFNPAIQNCDLKERVNCDGSPPMCLEPNGIIPNPENCGSFYKCYDGVPYLEECDKNLHFDAELNQCDEPCKVKCNKSIERPDSTTPSPNANPCPDPEGLYPVKGNCSSFYQCSAGKPYFAICPEGLHFNKLYDVCEDPCDAKCDPTINCSSRNKRSLRAFPNSFARSVGEKLKPCPFSNGVYPVKSDCTSYYMCVNGTAHLMRCPPGLHYSKSSKSCQPPCKAHCNSILECSNKIPSISGNCTCEDCFLPDPTDCSAYYLCKEHRQKKAYCPIGTLFNRKSSTCEKENTVNCEVIGDPVMCPESYGIFPYPGDCKKFLHCEDHVAHIKNCREGTFFDAERGVCKRSKESARCGTSVRDINCKKPTGIFPDSKNCSVFYHCENGVSFKKECSFPLLFNAITTVCDWPGNAICENESRSQEELMESSHMNNGHFSHRASKLMSLSAPEVCHDVPGVTCPCACRVPTYDDCSSFYHCRDDGKACKKHCPEGLYFNKKKMVCDLPSNVECRDFFFAAINSKRNLKRLQSF